MNCSPAAERVIIFLRPSISQSRLRRFPISYVEPLADHLAAQSAFYVDRAPAEPMTPALPIMPAILKGGQIVDRVLTTRNARLAPRPTLWKEYASRVKAGISRFPAFNFRYCFSSTNVETLPVCLLSATVVIFFPSGETVIFAIL